MRPVNSRRLIPLGLLILVATAAMAAEGTYRSVTDRPGVRADVQASVVTRFTSGMLLTSNRTTLSICVDAAAGARVTSVEVEQVEGALDDALNSVSSIFENALAYAATAQVVGGCPPPTAALTGSELGGPASSEPYTDLVGEPVRVWAPDAPSKHRVFVYYLADDAYSATFVTKPYARGAAEYYCSGGSCGQVTTGLYVPESIRSDILSEALLTILGLVATPQVDEPMTPGERNAKLREALRDAGVAEADIDGFFGKACELVPSACEDGSN